MPGSSNFLVFNPTDTTNTDDDATYASETQRTNGLQNGIAITSMHNKFYRQVSVMVAALGQYMANQGQTVNDSDMNALVTAITNSFATSTIKSSVRENPITSTSPQTILTFIPTSNDEFEFGASFRVINGATNVTIQLLYTSASGQQTYTAINAQPSPIGEYSIIPFRFNVIANQAITVSFTASIANQIYASASIREV